MVWAVLTLGLVSMVFVVPGLLLLLAWIAEALDIPLSPSSPM
ncbi:hypothetical protein [uncultured Mameliella sp.]|nr:hypothetical protein [uncultured Mameliella sp.]